MEERSNEDQPRIQPEAGGAPSTDSKPLVERAKNIIMRPKDEWPRIDAEPATIGGIYKSYAMILAAIPPLAGLIGALVFGYSFLGITYRPPVGSAVGFAVVQYVLSLVGIYVLALIIDALAPTFKGTKDTLKAFKVAAYSWTAAWIAGIFNIIPSLSWLSLLGLYSLYLLYLGLPRLMRVPEDKALGYTVVTVLVAIVIWVVIGAVATLFMGSPMTGPNLG